MNIGSHLIAKHMHTRAWPISELVAVCDAVWGFEPTVAKEFISTLVDSGAV